MLEKRIAGNSIKCSSFESHSFAMVTELVNEYLEENNPAILDISFVTRPDGAAAAVLIERVENSSY